MQVVNERRAQPRATLSGAVVVYLGDEKIDCSAVDISATGIAVQSKVIRSPGQFLRVNFCLHNPSGPARWYDADGVIARVARLEQGVLLGVQFLVVDTRAARDIHDYVEMSRMAVAAAQQREVYLRRTANGTTTSTAMPAEPTSSELPDELHPPPVTGEFGPPRRTTSAPVMPSVRVDAGQSPSDSSSAMPRPRRTSQVPRMPQPGQEGVAARATPPTGATRRATGETRRATGETRRITGQTPIVDVEGDPTAFDQPGASEPERLARPSTPRAVHRTPTMLDGRPAPRPEVVRPVAGATPRSIGGPDGPEPRRATPTPGGAGRTPTGTRPTTQTQRAAAPREADDTPPTGASNTNLRALYRAALDEVDGPKGKKKKR